MELIRAIYEVALFGQSAGVHFDIIGRAICAFLIVPHIVLAVYLPLLARRSIIDALQERRLRAAHRRWRRDMRRDSFDRMGRPGSLRALLEEAHR